jgi:single-stranded-DNA-specific exonuclease
MKESAHGSRAASKHTTCSMVSLSAPISLKVRWPLHAAGLTIRQDRIQELRRRLNAHAAASLTDEQLQPFIRIDAELPAEAVSFPLADQLSTLEPFGAGNPRPVFLTRNLRVISAPVVLKEQHLKMRLAGSEGRPLETIWWRGFEQLGEMPMINASVEMAYSIETNTWNNEMRLQLSVADLRLGDGGLRAREPGANRKA